MGLDVSGYSFRIDTDAIREITAVELLPGQVFVTGDILANLPAVVANPDKIYLDGKSRDGHDILVFETLLDGNNYIHTMEVRPEDKVLLTKMLRVMKVEE
jgi:hypothetical protein